MKTKIILASFIITAAAYGDNSLIKLGETVVSTIGYETTLRETPKNVQVITQEEIQKKNYSNVTDILRDSPLVTVREDEFGAIIDMRGSGLNAKATVQIMIDSVSINPIDINHGTIPLNTIPISNIEKIEILPGGNGVLYGDGATGGVVNIITKFNSEKKTSFNLGSRLGSYSSKDWNMGAGTGFGDLGIQVNYSGTDKKSHRADEKYEKENFDISGKYEITSKDRITLKYSYADEKSKTAQMLTAEQIKNDRFQSGIDYSGNKSGIDENGDVLDTSHIVRNEVMGVYEKDITDSLKFNLLGSYQKSTNNSAKKDLSLINISPNFIDYRDYYADTIGTFTEEKLKITPSLKYIYKPNSYLIAGYDFKKQESKRSFDNFSDMYKVYELDTEKTTHGAFVLNKTTVDNFEFVQGFRREWTTFHIDKLTHYYHRVKPGFLNGGYVDSGLQRDTFNKSMQNDALELSINYLYSNTGNVYARFEKSFRTPSPSEFQDKDGTDYQTNNLDAEKNQSIEIGVKDYAFGSFLSANLFFTRTEGEIFYEEVTHGKEWYYSNLDKTERKGVELSAEQYFDKLTFTQNFSYLNSEIVSESSDTSVVGNAVPYTPKINFNVSARYEFTDKFNTILSVNYKDKYYIDRANDYRAGSNITTNLTLNYAIKSGLDVYVGVNNLFDRNNYDNVAIKEESMVFDPSASRNYYTGFRYQF
ncbi:MAG: TonB-dependent receptor family protein [Fusobacteriaceae bacterium]